MSDTTEKKRGRGRPRRNTRTIGVRLLPDEVVQLDAWRLRRPDKPPRAAAIRRMVQIAMKRK
jgi:hypothetical protein